MNRNDSALLGGIVRALLAAVFVRFSTEWSYTLFRIHHPGEDLLPITECLIAIRGWIMVVPLVCLFLSIFVRRRLGGQALCFFIQILDCGSLALCIAAYLGWLVQNVAVFDM